MSVLNKIAFRLGGCDIEVKLGDNGYENAAASFAHKPFYNLLILVLRGLIKFKLYNIIVFVYRLVFRSY